MTKSKIEILKEFEKLRTFEGEGWGWVDKEEATQFLSKAITQAERRGRDEVLEEMKKECHRYPDGCSVYLMKLKKHDKK